MFGEKIYVYSLHQSVRKLEGDSLLRDRDRDLERVYLGVKVGSVGTDITISLPGSLWL